VNGNIIQTLQDNLESARNVGIEMNMNFSPVEYSKKRRKLRWLGFLYLLGLRNKW
jgi:hypothetical protein